MQDSFEFYHWNGQKIKITDIPVLLDDKQSKFDILWKIEALIDEINYMGTPKSSYSMKLLEND